MSDMMKSFGYLRQLCDRADVVGTPRVSITFDSDRDKALFEAEMMRQIKNTVHFRQTDFFGGSVGQMTIYGIKLRLP